MQILYVPECQHCLTVGCIDGSKLTRSVELQIASIFAPVTQDETLVATLVPVQQQVGAVDCGVFAAAFTLHAEKGDNLRKLRFDQSRMRSHLIQCFEKQKLEGFPLLTCKPHQVKRAKLAHCVIYVSAECQMFMIQRWLPVTAVTNGFITNVLA